MTSFWVSSIAVVTLVLGLSNRAFAESEPLAVVRPLPREVTFVYIHGFGEHREVLPFHEEMEEFLGKWELKAAVETYRWDDLELQPTMLVAQWNQSKERVVSKVPDFTESIIRKYESLKKPYVLIGYSLGSRLVAASLKENKEPLESLLGVYFLGSALPNNHSFDEVSLPPGMKIANYYSSKFDVTLKFSFYHAEGIRAGGETGFDNPLIENYRTACTHMHLVGPLHRDYSSLASAIGWLTYYKQGVYLSPAPDDKMPSELALPAGSGKIHWNEIHRFGSVIIEENANADIYRAIQVTPENKRSHIGWSRNMHQLLGHIGLYPEDSIKMRVSPKPKKLTRSQKVKTRP